MPAPPPAFVVTTTLKGPKARGAAALVGVLARVIACIVGECLRLPPQGQEKDQDGHSRR